MSATAAGHMISYSMTLPNGQQLTLNDITKMTPVEWVIASRARNATIVMINAFPMYEKDISAARAAGFTVTE